MEPNNDNNDNKDNPNIQGVIEPEANVQSPSSSTGATGAEIDAIANATSPASSPRSNKSQQFSPLRGSMDDYKSRDSTGSSSHKNSNSNGTDIEDPPPSPFPLTLPSSTSNKSNKVMSDNESEYDEEEDGMFRNYKKTSQMQGGAMMITSTSPVNLYDLSATGSPDAIFPPRGANARQSNLLVRHFTKAALMDGTYENEVVDMSPALKRRLRDFRFAQKKRRERYGEQNPWGIIGLYDHLTGIRTDIEWAEDAAWRRENEQPYLSWQDFEDAKDTGFNQPFFTYFIMFTCTVCLIVSIGLNNWTVDSLTNNPMIGPSADVLIQMGAKYTPKIVDENEWFRVFTAMFLHAGIIHFVVNMLALWFIGYAVEQSHGFLSAALLFILPAIGGTLFSALFLPEYISVGASGGIFGLIGACIADIISNWSLLFSKHVNENNQGQLFRHVKVLIWLILDIILNIVIGLTPFVDNFTHMGGMFFGFFCGLSTMERLSKAFFGMKTNWLSRVQTFLVRFFGIIFSVICIIVGFVVLASLKNGANFKCRGCRYVSCVPFPFWETENKWWYCDDCNKPVVKAQLYQDMRSNVYTHMDLTCPDNSTIFNITLTDSPKNKEFVKGKLSSYCRQECDVLFSK